jgi:hypothetical protein
MENLPVPPAAVSMPDMPAQQTGPRLISAFFILQLHHDFIYLRTQHYSNGKTCQAIPTERCQRTMDAYFKTVILIIARRVSNMISVQSLIIHASQDKMPRFPGPDRIMA